VALKISVYVTLNKIGFKALRGVNTFSTSSCLDGRQLQNLEQYRATSDVFNMTVAENNAFQSQSGTFPAMADGFFAFLEPLQPGEHTLVLEQSVLNPVQPEYNFASRTNYVLTVEP